MNKTNMKQESIFQGAINANSVSGIVLLTLIIIYTPNQLHFPQSLGVKGLNVYNLLFILVFVSSTAYSSIPTPLKGSIYIFWLVCFIGVGVSYSNYSHNLISDLTYLKTIIFYMSAYFIGYRYSKNEASIRYILTVVLVVVFVAGLEAIKEAFAYGIGSYVESHRVAGPFGVSFYSANRAGVFYSMFSTLFLYLYLNLKSSKSYRMFLLAGFVITFFAVIFTYSRQSYFILAFCSIYLLAKNSKVILILLLLIVPFYESWLPESAIQRVEGTQQIDKKTGEEKLDVSTESRFIIWKAAWEMIKDNPFGVGLNQFQSTIKPYLGYEKDAHNHYVLTMAELGVQGIILLLLLFLRILRLVIKAKESSSLNLTKSVSEGFYFVTIAMFLSNIYGSPFYMGEVMFCYWVLLGVVARIYTMNNVKLRYDEK